MKLSLSGHQLHNFIRGLDSEPNTVETKKYSTSDKF